MSAGAAFNAVCEAILGSAMKPEGEFLLAEITRQDIELESLRAQLRTAEDAQQKAERERDEAQAESAAAIKFIECEAGWEYFRAEFWLGNKERVSSSGKNADKLMAFVRSTGHGLKLLSEYDEARAEVQRLHAKLNGEQYDSACLRSEVQRLKEDASTVAHLRNVLQCVRDGKGCGAHFTDSEVAGKVRMLMRDDLDHEVVCVMARDRIIALSDEVQRLSGQVEEMRHRIRKARQILSTAPYAPEAIDAAMGAPGEGQDQTNND